MKTKRSLRKDQSGQVLPLAAIALLAMAAVVFMSLNVSWTVHNRIRLQNYADAKAYSTAVQEARAFNFFAYTNRAIANAYVEAATAHAYMSEAASLATLYWAMFEGFGIISGIEYGLAAACFDAWDIGGGIEHTIHGIEADINGIGYMVGFFEETEQKRLQPLDDPFGQFVTACKDHIDDFWRIEKLYATDLQARLVIGEGLSKVKEDNMQAPNKTGVNVSDTYPVLGVLNEKAFKKAINKDDGNENKKIEMTNVVNATRPPFTWDRNSLVGSAATPDQLFIMASKDVQNDAWVESDGFNGPLFFTQMPNIFNFLVGGRTYLGDKDVSAHSIGFINSDMPNDAKGDRISSADWLQLTFSWKDGVAPELPLPAFVIPGGIGMGEVTTGKSGSDHNGDSLMGTDLEIIGSPHDSNVKHDQWEIDPSKFMDYGIATGKPYNQPVVYAAASADLKEGDAEQKRPWEINGNPLSLPVGGQAGTGTITSLSDTTNGGKALAISKAMVYYHRFGDWKEEPNFFNPYWRAKLESWDGKKELGEALTATGQVSELASMGALDVGLGAGAVNAK